MNMKKVLLAFFISCIALNAFAQCTGTQLNWQNPSFEGTAGTPHVTPPLWDICQPGTTPDTQPGCWGVTLPPSNGSSYIGLVEQPSGSWYEGASQLLSSPMIAGTTYTFTMDLATIDPSVDWGSTGIYPGCVELQIWGNMGGNSGCDESYLCWSSGNITNFASWQTHTVTFTPTANWTNLLFMIHGLGCSDGAYLLMDNMTAVVPVSDVPQFVSNAVCVGNATSFTDNSTSTGTVSTWNWDFGDGSPLSTAQNPTHTYSTAGTFNTTLTITSTVPCTTTVSHSVVVNPLPTADAGLPQTICNGQNASLTATGGGSYQWNTGTATAFISVAPAANTTYTVTVTNLGCTASDNVAVNVNPLPIADAGPAQTICPSVTASLTASGVGTYQWNTGQPTAILLVSPAITTTYTVTVTNLGCTASDDITVTVNAALTADAGAPQTVCNGQSVTLIATGGTTYQWAGGPATNTYTVSPATTTTYTVTAYSGGCSGTDDIVVSVNPTPPINAGNDTTICNGSVAYLNASGGSTYVWSPAGTLSATNINNPVAFPVASTTYTVTATTAVGCTAVDNVIVSIAPALTINAGSDINICQGGSTTLNATGGATYAWSPASTLDNSTISNPVATPAAITTYIVTAYDAMGCSGTDNITIGFNPNPAPVVSPSGQTGFCDSASVNVVLDAGSGYTSYTWSNGTNTQTDVITQLGIYDVTVVDLNGCTGTSPGVTVYIHPPMPAPIIYPDGPASFCQGDSVELYLLDPWYMYQWSSGSMTPHIYVFETNDYVVTVTDSFGCVQVSQPFPVDVTPQPHAYASYAHQMLDASFYNFSLNVDSWTWDFGDGQNSTLSDPTHLYTATGVYTVIFTASNSCGTDSDTLIVNLPGPEGINDYGNGISDLQVYPVPVSDNVFVAFKSDASNIELQVHDVLGKLVYSKTYSDINGKFLESIDMSGKAAGLYLMELRTENSISVRKFNKN